MTPKMRFVFWLGSVTFTSILGFKLASRPTEVAQNPKEMLANINNRPVTREEVDKVYLLYRGATVGELIMGHLLRQTAVARKVDPKTDEQPVDVATRELRESTLRRLVLKEWPDERLRRFHALFQDELAEYEISMLEVIRASDLGNLEEDLAQELDFDSLATRYAVDEQGKRHESRRWFSRTELDEEFGEKVTEGLIASRPGQFSKPIRSQSRVYILNLCQKRSRYEDLKPMLEQRAVESCGPVLLYDLLAKAKISAGAALGGNSEALEYGL